MLCDTNGDRMGIDLLDIRGRMLHSQPTPLLELLSVRGMPKKTLRPSAK